MSVDSNVKQERSRQSFSCQIYWDNLLSSTPQEIHLLQSLKKTDLSPGDILVLASRLGNDPEFVKRFRKNIYGFLLPGKLSFNQNVTP